MLRTCNSRPQSGKKKREMTTAPSHPLPPSAPSACFCTQRHLKLRCCVLRLPVGGRTSKEPLRPRGGRRFPCLLLRRRFSFFSGVWGSELSN